MWKENLGTLSFVQRKKIHFKLHDDFLVILTAFYKAGSHWTLVHLGGNPFVVKVVEFLFKINLGVLAQVKGM